MTPSISKSDNALNTAKDFNEAFANLEYLYTTEMIGYDDFLQAIKLAISQFVIGEDEEQPDFQRLQATYDTVDLLLERNELKAKMRQALFNGEGKS